MLNQPAILSFWPIYHLFKNADLRKIHSPSLLCLTHGRDSLGKLTLGLGGLCR